MPFGLMNAAQAFQRLMDTICHSLDFAFVYIDNILVASKDIKTQRTSSLAIMFNFTLHVCTIFSHGEL